MGAGRARGRSERLGPRGRADSAVLASRGCLARPALLKIAQPRTASTLQPRQLFRVETQAGARPESRWAASGGAERGGAARVEEGPGGSWAG